MGLKNFAEEAKLLLEETLEDYIQNHPMRRGSRMQISAVMTPERVKIQVSVSGDHGKKDRSWHLPATPEQIEFLRNVHFSPALAGMVNFFLNNGNNPITWGELTKLSGKFDSGRATQINKILRQMNSSIELRAAVWDENGKRIHTWSQPVCFRVVRTN